MPSAHRDLVVVGASAGGVEALRSMVSGLPADLPAAVAVVLHLPSGGTSALPQILSRSGPLPAVTALSGMPIQPGRIYAAPPDHHLLVVGDQFVLSHGPTESGHRPAVNALFRSAAIAAGPRVVGTMLSGVLDDGVAGLVAIKARGGAVVVQDPADALYSGMPEKAMRYVTPDRVVPAVDIGRVLTTLTLDPIRAGAVSPPSRAMEVENDIAQERAGARPGGGTMIGEASNLTCPDCQGVLNEVEPTSHHYRCQVGHAWSVEALLAAQGDVFERALWTALRSLEEKASLSRRMHATAVDRGDRRSAERYARVIEETCEAAEVLRRHLTAVPAVVATETDT